MTGEKQNKNIVENRISLSLPRVRLKNAIKSVSHHSPPPPHHIYLLEKPLSPKHGILYTNTCSLIGRAASEIEIWPRSKVKKKKIVS